jgi:hypothetical protein
VSATGDLIGRYGNFGFGRPGRRRSYQVDFTVSGFQVRAPGRGNTKRRSVRRLAGARAGQRAGSGARARRAPRRPVPSTPLPDPLPAAPLPAAPQFALASGPSNARVATRPVSVQQLSSSVAAGTGTLVYNINAPYGLGTGNGNFTFPLAGRAVDFAKGCSLAFRPAPYNDVLLDCSRLKVGLSRFNVASANGTSSVNVNIVFAGYKVKASAPITAATSA